MNVTLARLDPLTPAAQSAGHDSLETVADFRNRNMGADLTHSTSAFIAATTPRLNSSTLQSGRLNLTQNGEGTEDS